MSAKVHPVIPRAANFSYNKPTIDARSDWYIFFMKIFE